MEKNFSYCYSIKVWLQEDQTRLTKLLLVLFYLGGEKKVKMIKDCCRQLGFTVPKTWNVSSILGSSKGLAIRTDKGWEITSKGVEHLKRNGFEARKSASTTKANDLRDLLPTISNTEAKDYIEEAIVCMEHQLHRAAVVMSWSAAIYVLRRHTVENYLSEFNNDAARVNSRWRAATNEDELGLMKEVDFLDCLQRVSVIGKDVKLQLKEPLTLRNSCGHPNSLKIEKLKVASHIETLIQNVFQRFNV